MQKAAGKAGAYRFYDAALKMRSWGQVRHLNYIAQQCTQADPSHQAALG